MQDLIQKMFTPAFKSKHLEAAHDGAFLEIEGKKLAFTTDSYVVHPLFFPGGDIGSMAVYGTVNDLAMCGAKPLYLSVGFIIEEGLSTDILYRIVNSMAEAVKKASAELVTGDTKVVDRGKGDGIFINTAGIGLIQHNLCLGPDKVECGDQILLNGDLGRHGMAIMAVRQGLAFETKIESDSAPLADLVEILVQEGIQIHCMRDLTRGGLSSALNEIAQLSKVTIRIEEKNIPVRDDVRGACEILGLDPLYVANEGRFVAFIPKSDSQRALSLMKKYPLGQETRIIGEVINKKSSLVTMINQIGTTRIVDMLSGEQLPRIC